MPPTSPMQLVVLASTLAIAVLASPEAARADAELAVVAGPLLKGFVGLEGGYAWNGRVSARLQLVGDGISSSNALWLSGWAQTTGLAPVEALEVGPLVGIRAISSLPGINPNASTLSIVPRLILGATVQRAWGSWWARLSPSFGWEPLAGSFFFAETLGGSPPLLEVGYRVSRQWDVSLRLTPYSPLKVTYVF